MKTYIQANTLPDSNSPNRTQLNRLVDVRALKNDFLSFDTMLDMRNMDIDCRRMIADGEVKGVILNGYYKAGDTPKPIEYLTSTTERPANDIDVIQVDSLKLEHTFSNSVDVSYAGIKGDGTNESTKIQQIFDLFGDIIVNTHIYATAVNITRPTKLVGKGRIFTIESHPAVNILSSDVVVDGVEISSPYDNSSSRSIGIGSPNQSGVAPATIKNITIKNAIIENTLWYSNVENLVIKDCKIKNGSITCWFGNYKKVLITGNIIDNDETFKGNGINATFTYPTTETFGQRNIVISNNVISCYRMGFEWRDRLTDNSSDNNVSGIFCNNQVHIKGDENQNQHPFGISLNSGGWSISNNVLTKEFNDNRGFGMEIVQSANNTIVGNQVWDFNEGICVYEATPRNNPSALNNMVNNNSLYNCGNNAIRVWRGSGRTSIIGNHVYMPKTSFYGINISGDQLTADSNLGKKVSICRDIVIQGNIIHVDVDPTDTRSKRIINITSAENVMCTGNAVTLTGEALDNTQNYSIIGVYLGQADNVTVSGNTLTGTHNNTKNQSAGVAIAEINGRNCKIFDNEINNFQRNIMNVGAALTYEVMAYNNRGSNINGSSTLSDNSKYVRGIVKTKKTATTPVFGVYAIGDQVYKNDGTAYFQCTTAGTLKTRDDITATYEAGSNKVVVNKVLGLEVDDWLDLEGTSLPVRIVNIDFNNLTLTLNRNVTLAGTNVVVRFRAPVFKEIAI